MWVRSRIGDKAVLRCVHVSMRCWRQSSRGGSLSHVRCRSHNVQSPCDGRAALCGSVQRRAAQHAAHEAEGGRSKLPSG